MSEDQSSPTLGTIEHVRRSINRVQGALGDLRHSMDALDTEIRRRYGIEDRLIEVGALLQELWLTTFDWAEPEWDSGDSPIRLRLQLLAALLLWKDGDEESKKHLAENWDEARLLLQDVLQRGSDWLEEWYGHEPFSEARDQLIKAKPLLRRALSENRDEVAPEGEEE